MAEEKKDYIVEYLVQADISQAANSLTALTTMMETFQRNHAASIRQASTAADRILKARERFSKGFVDKLDLSKPIGQLEAFQKKMVKTFSNLSNMMVAMNKGDFEQLGKTLGYLQKATGDVGNTAKKTTANIISGTKKVSDAVVSSTKKQTAATNAQTQAIIKQDNALSKLYSKVNAQNLKGNKSLSASKNVFSDDERRQLKNLFGRNWASKSIKSIESGILKQMGNPINESAAVNRAHAKQFRQMHEKRNLIKGIIDKVKKAEALKNMPLTEREEAALKGISTRWSSMKPENLIGKLDKAYADIKVPKGISDISKLEAAETKKAAEALAKKAASAQKPIRQTLTKDEQKEFNKLQNKLKPLFASEEKYKGKVDELRKKALGKRGLSVKQTAKLNNFETLLSGVQDKQKEVGLARYKELAAKDAGFEKVYQKNLAEYEKLSQIAAQNQAAATTPTAVVTPAKKGKAAPVKGAVKAGGINPFGMLSAELNERVSAIRELMTLSSSGKVVTIPIRLDTTGVFGMLERIKGEIAYIRSIARGLQIGKFSTGGVTSAGGAATKGGKKVGKNANQVMVDLVPGNIDAFRKQLAKLKDLPVKVDAIPNLDKLRTRLANAKGLKITVAVDTVTPTGKKWTPQSVAPSRGTTTTQGTAGRRPPRASREMQGTRKQIMRSSAYPLVGNTSFGVQTPAFVNMAKGMVGMMGIGAAFGLIGDAMHQAVEYQNTMMSVKAILESNKRYTGYTPENFRAMEKNIRRVGMDTKFTAPEVAGAARFMAMAGLSVDQINNSIRPIADVALIGDNDLETTADKITNIQTAFKLGKDPRSMRKLADNLTTTFTRFNTDMMMTAEAMQYAAPVASAAGLGIEDTLAMIGVMGNAGIQSSMAGTTLRMAMQNIIKPNKNQKKLWDKLGISRHNADGSPRNIVDVLTELRSKASDAQLMETVSNLFRTTSMAGTVQIIRNLDLLKAAREDMLYGRDSGISEQLSYEKQNTIKGLWAQVTSAFTEDNVLMFEKFQNSLRGMLIDIRDYLKSPEAIQNLENIMELIKTMGSAFGTVARIWMGIYNTFPGAVKAMMVLQFAMSQIGMLLNPFIGLFRVARNMGNFFGITAAAGGAVSGGAGVAGVVGANVMSRYASRYGTMAALGKGFSRSFTTAKSFGALSSLTGIAGMGMSGLGALLGTLLNPITLSLAGIAGSVYLIQKTTSDKKQLQDKSAMSLKSQQKQLDDISSKKLDEKYFSTFDQFARPYINGYGKEKAISVFDRLRGINRQFTARRTAHKKLGALESSELLFSDPGWTTTNIEYNRELINSYIKPISTNSVLGSVLAPYIDKDINSSYGHQGNYRKIAGIASIIREGGTSSLVGKYRDRIVDIISKAAFSNDPNAMQNAISRSKALIETFRQTGLKTATLNAKNMSIDDMGNYAPIRFTQYWDAGTAMLEDLVNNKRNKYLKQVYALSEHADITVMGAEEWIKNVDDILSSVAVNIDGKLMTLDFKNGSPIFDELIKKCKDLGMSFTDSLNARLMILQDISDTLNNIPGAKDALMTLQQLIDRLNVLKELGPNEFVKKYYGIDIKDSLGDAFHKVEKKDVEIPLKSENENPLVMYKWGEEKKQKWGWATHDPISETLQQIEKNTNQDKIESKMNNITNPGGKTTGGGGNPKPSDYTVDQSGYGNHYQRSAARPTQIVLNVDKLVNIDKTEINSMEDRELVSKLEFIVSQAATQLAATAAAQISALGSATGDTQDIG